MRKKGGSTLPPSLTFWNHGWAKRKIKSRPPHVSTDTERTGLSRSASPNWFTEANSTVQKTTQPSQPSKGSLADRDRDDHCLTVLIFTSASPLAHKSVSFPLLGLGVGGKTVAIASQFANLFHLWGVEKSLRVSLLLADKKGRPISICHHW